jgi:hypothetical protein
MDTSPKETVAVPIARALMALDRNMIPAREAVNGAHAKIGRKKEGR